MGRAVIPNKKPARGGRGAGEFLAQVIPLPRMTNANLRESAGAVNRACGQRRVGPKKPPPGFGGRGLSKRQCRTLCVCVVLVYRRSTRSALTTITC
jgi:hypothetical protein